MKKILSTTIFSNYLYHHHHHRRCHIGIYEMIVNSEIVSRNVHTKTTRSERDRSEGVSKTHWYGCQDILLQNATTFIECIVCA